MQQPPTLLRYRWYWYFLFLLASLISGLTIAALSQEVQTAIRIYERHGLSELVYLIEEEIKELPAELLPSDPNVEWQSAPPEALGLDPGKLSDLESRLATLNTRAFVVVKGGKIVHEYYSSDFGPNRQLRLSASGKGIAASIALAVALDEGLVDMDSPAWQFIPAWEDDPVRSKITVRHLIAHSSGIENVRWGSQGLLGWKDEFDRDLSARFPLALNVAPIRFQPGSRFEYSSTGYYVLSYILTGSLGNVPESDIQTLLQNRIMGPLGVPSSAWSLDFMGPHNLNGLELYYAGDGRYTARAIARIGQLMLNQGVWNGQTLIQPETVRALVSYGGSPVSRPTDLNHPTWGLGWRLNDDGFFPSLPRDSFLALRGSDRVMLVVPSHDLVMVRFGESLTDGSINERTWSDLDERLFRPLMEAIIQ